MTTDERVEQTVTHLLDEVRREPVPELDWARLETSLLARAAASPSVKRKASLSVPRILALAALSLVAVLGAIGVLRHGGSAPGTGARETTFVTADTAANVNGDALALGARVTASTAPVVVSHLGHATWTLDPDSEAHLESVGDVITVALDRGVLSAHVVKSPHPESFVVRVERTRIAVHGTAFRVERLATTVHIGVTEGVVAVGPIGGTPFELVAPSSATVTLDGVRADLTAPASNRPPSGVTAAPAVTSRTPESPVASAAPGKEKAKAPPAADPAQVAGVGVDRVVASIQECFGEHTVSRGDLRVTVLTRMSLHVQASGRIGEAEFDPPLVSAVRSCVDQAVAHITLASSDHDYSVGRVLELER